VLTTNVVTDPRPVDGYRAKRKCVLNRMWALNRVRTKLEDYCYDLNPLNEVQVNVPERKDYHVITGGQSQTLEHVGFPWSRGKLNSFLWPLCSN
jgi:hypothetical protein